MNRGSTASYVSVHLLGFAPQNKMKAWELIVIQE
jgi:hypothetical protein